MAEDPNKNASDGDGNKGNAGAAGEGGDAGDAGEDFKAMYERERAKNEDIIKNRQAVKAKNEDLTAQLAALSSEVAELKGSKGKVDKDALLAKIEELQNEAKDFKKREQETKIKDVVYAQSSRFANVDDAYLLIKPHLDTEIKDGRARVIVKDEPWTKPEDFIQQFLEKKPHLAVNSKNPGSNSKGTPENQSGQTDGVPTDFQSWPRKKRQEWIKDNMKLAYGSAADTLLREAE